MKYLILLFLLFGCASGPSSRLPAGNHKACFSSMSLFFSYGPYYNASAPHSPLQIDLTSAQTLDDIEKAYGGWSFFHSQGALPTERINANNEKLKQALAQGLELDERAGKVTSLSEIEAKEVYESMKNNNVVRCDLSYERAGTSIGFCFGRATIAHMEALRLGVHPGSIKKIWGVGDMGHWGHHVATMVKTNDGWQVIDNVIGFVKAETWMQKMAAQQNGNKPVMFFVSSPERFGPASNAGYKAEDLFGNGEDDYYNGFFRDYFSWLADQPPAIPFSERRP